MISHGPKFLYALSYTTILITMVGYVLVWALHISNPFLVLAIISVFYQLARGDFGIYAMECVPLCS